MCLATRSPEAALLDSPHMTHGFLASAAFEPLPLLQLTDGFAGAAKLASPGALHAVPAHE